MKFMCAVIECEEPDVPSGGYVTGFDFTIHSEIVYHCEVGHILSGDTMRKCLPTGTWSGNPPSCTCKSINLNSVRY